MGYAGLCQLTLMHWESFSEKERFFSSVGALSARLLRLLPSERSVLRKTVILESPIHSPRDPLF